MILAAGEGTRLRPLTLNTPKPMLPIANKPLLAYILDWLRFYDVTEIAINLHHLPNVIIDWLGNGDRFDVNITYSVEDVILGTAGALTKLRDFLDDTFIVIYSDMLTDLNIPSMLKFHQTKGALITIALMEVEDPGGYGIVEIDEKSRILRFVEKPAPGTTSSNLANAGFYILQPQVIDYIPQDTFYDFGYNLFPELLSKGEKLFGYTTADSFLDTGTMENYHNAEREILEGRFSPKRISINGK